MSRPKARVVLNTFTLKRLPGKQAAQRRRWSRIKCECADVSKVRGWVSSPRE